MNSLDAQLSKLISKFWQTDNPPTLLLWVYYTKQSFQSSLLDHVCGQNSHSKYPCCKWDEDSPLHSDLRKLIRDPSRRTKQMLDTLCDANIGAHFMKVLLLQKSSSMQVLMHFYVFIFFKPDILSDIMVFITLAVNYKVHNIQSSNLLLSICHTFYPIRRLENALLTLSATGVNGLIGNTLLYSMTTAQLEYLSALITLGVSSCRDTKLSYVLSDFAIYFPMFV